MGLRGWHYALLSKLHLTGSEENQNPGQKECLKSYDAPTKYNWQPEMDDTPFLEEGGRKQFMPRWYRYMVSLYWQV